MLWVVVFGGIALAGLVMLVCYAVWLAHKAADVMSEVSMLGDRAAELSDLVSQVRFPEARLVSGGVDPDQQHRMDEGAVPVVPESRTLI